MRCWLFLCTIYVVTYYTDEHLVVLNQNAKSTEKGQNSKEDEKRLENDSSRAEGGDTEWGSSGEGGNNEIIDANDSSGESVEDGNGNAQENDQNKEISKIFGNEKDNENAKARKLKNWMRWASEITKGNPLEVMGANPHTYQPDKYLDLNRRFVLQYPYSDNGQYQNIEYAPPNKEIVPIEAPEELVMLVAKESAMKVAAQPRDPDEGANNKKLLRSGDFWNGIWQEEGQAAKTALRSPNIDPTLGVIKAKIMPGNEFYDVIAKMKKMSPRLLYIINEKEDNDD